MCVHLKGVYACYWIYPFEGDATRSSTLVTASAEKGFCFLFIRKRRSNIAATAYTHTRARACKYVHILCGLYRRYRYTGVLGFLVGSRQRGRQNLRTYKRTYDTQYIHESFLIFVRYTRVRNVSIYILFIKRILIGFTCR